MLMDPLNNTMSNMLMTRPKPNTIHLMLLIPTVPKRMRSLSTTVAAAGCHT